MNLKGFKKNFKKSSLVLVILFSAVLIFKVVLSSTSRPSKLHIEGELVAEDKYGGYLFRNAGWYADFERKDKWHITYGPGSFFVKDGVGIIKTSTGSWVDKCFINHPVDLEKDPYLVVRAKNLTGIRLAINPQHTCKPNYHLGQGEFKREVWNLYNFNLSDKRGKITSAGFRSPSTSYIDFIAFCRIPNCGINRSMQ